MKTKNIVTATDSYKFTHWPMYPSDTETVYSYFESREGATFPETVFFGLQYLIKEYLEGVVVTKEKIEQAKKLSEAHFGSKDIFNESMWNRIVEVYGGKLPIKIKAVPEGTPVPTGNVLMTIENTDPKCSALTNHLETLLTHVWGPSTIASLSRETKKICKEYLDETCEQEVADGALKFMLHDFGYRGVNQSEAASIGGAGHLINFLGTDTIASMECVMDYYGASLEDGIAYSVPATEHSVMTSGGPEGEYEVFENILNSFPNGIVSVVIDSYDWKRFISEYAEKLKDKILNRNGKVVFRPDSGNPILVTLEVLDRLEEVFGSTVNEKGYKVLNSKVGVLWGDGIDKDGIEQILRQMKMTKWSASNIVFGMGGGLLQKVNRDTQRFAFKCSAQQRDGVWVDIFKDPIDSSKASKRGRLILTKDEDSNFKTEKTENVDDPKNLLETVFNCGKLVKEYNLKEIRKNASFE